MALDLDRRRVGGAGFRGVRDPGQLVEDEGPDRGEEDDGQDRPQHLEPGRAVNLRAFGGTCPLAAPVLDDECDERPFDDQEDHAAEDRHEDERVLDAMRVRRVRARQQEPAASCVRTRGRGQGDKARKNGGKGGPAHPGGIV